MNQQLDLSKLFMVIDSIVCALWECVDDTNTKYFISIGYIANLIILKLDTEDDGSLYRFELTSPREAKEKMEWIISEKQLVVKIATYFYDPSVNISSDFYSKNEILYTFNSRGRVKESIDFTYKLHSFDLDENDMRQNYHKFLEMIRNNEYGLPVNEQKPYLITHLRRNKFMSLGTDWLE